MNGRELRVIRDLSGLPIVQFAQTLGVGKTTIQRYERGDSPIPPAFSRKVIATFGITPEMTLEIREIAQKMDRVKQSIVAGE